MAHLHLRGHKLLAIQPNIIVGAALGRQQVCNVLCQLGSVYVLWPVLERRLHRASLSNESFACKPALLLLMYREVGVSHHS